jgi:GNAT superfamily N-acetyltransferase
MKRRPTGGGTALRFATAADVPALFAIRTSVRENHLDLRQLAERGVTPASVLATLNRDRSCTWVTEAAGEVTAFCMANAREGTIFALFVHPDREGRGYGRALLRTAEDWLFNAGWKTIWLQTGAEPHFRAHGFYRAAGWVLIGPADHGDVRYEKNIAGKERWTHDSE